MKDKTNKKKKSKILALLLWLIFGLFSFVIFISFSLILINNFSFLRKPTLNFVLNIVNNSLIAKVEIGDIKFHKIDKLSIYQVNLITDGDTLAHFDKLYTSIKIVDLINNRITIRKLYLNGLNIKILRNPIDSIWNYSKIAKPSEEKSAPAGKTPIIDIRNLKINNSKILIFDKLSLNKEMYFNPTNLNMQNFNIELKAFLDLDNAKSKLNLYNLSFFEQVKDIKIDSLRIFAELSNDITQLDSFLLVINNSKVKLNSQFTKFNPLNQKLSNNIEEADIKLSINIQNFNPNIINKFVMVPLKEAEVNVSLNANGNLNRLKVNNLVASFNQTEINANVLLTNLINQDLIYDASLTNSKIYQKDVESLLSIDLSSIPKFEYALIRKLDAVGTIYNVNATGNIITNAGAIDFEGGAGWNKIIDYYIKANAKNINLGSLFTSDALQSNLNGIIDAKGSGTSFDDLQVIANLDLSEFNFLNISFSGLKTDVKIDKYDIYLDTFQLKFPDKWDEIYLEAFEQKLESKGRLNFNDITNPNYHFDIEFSNLNFAKILNNSVLPNNFSGKMFLNGKSFNLDSMTAQINSEISDLSYPTMSFLPFNFNFNTYRDDSGKKIISAGIMDDSISIYGNYSLYQLINTSLNLTDYISEYFKVRFNQFFKNDTLIIDTTRLDSISKNLKFSNFDFELFADFNNLTFLNNIIPHSDFNTSFQINGFGRASEDNFFLDFNNTKMGKSSILFDKTKIKFDDFIFNFSFDLSKRTDSVFVLSFGNINIEELDKLNINNFIILKPEIDLLSLENTFFVECGLFYDTLFSSYIDLKGTLNEDNIDLQIPKINISVLNELSFSNNSVPKIKLDNDGFDIDEFRLFGKNREEIKIVGGISKNKFQNMSVKINNFNPFKYPDLITFATNQKLVDINANISNFEFLAEGAIEDPQYSVDLQIDSLNFRGKNFGSIVGMASYKNKVIQGSFVQTIDKEIKPLNLVIDKFPINLGLNDSIGKMDGEYQFKAILDKFNVSIIEPFIPFVKQLEGEATAGIEISGKTLEDYQINGNLLINETNFLLIQNNISYNLNSNITFSDNKIAIDNLKINNKNIQNSVNLTGDFNFENNTISDINLTASAKDFIVLDDVSKKSIPQFYGRLSLSTKEKPILIKGDLENLVVDGSIQINPSNLTIANLNQNGQVVKTNFIYKKVGEIARFEIETIDSNKLENKEIYSPKKVQSNNIPEVQLNVFIPKTINLKIDLGAIGEIIAILGTSDPTEPVVFTMGKTAPYGQLTGELLIKDGSLLDSYKKMKASGRIFFQSQDITNPYINLESSYKGKIEEENTTILYEVFIKINGPAQSPQVNFDYTINGISPQGERKQIEENALYLLIFGRLPSEGIGTSLVDQSIVNQLSDAGISSLASRSLSDLLLKTGVIESADFEINSQDFEKTRINFKGKLYGSVNWSLGGNIGDITRNNQIVLELPVSTNSELFNQVFWMFSYSTNLNSLAIDPDEKNWELKLKLGGSW